MKKFKFRAWDKVHKEMINWEQYKDELVSSDFTDEDLVLMQYTGLKDRNGVEIYEGDICKVSDAEPYSNDYFITDYNWQMIMYVDFEYGAFQLRQIEDKYMSIYYIETQDMDIEVIGNIYENPELVKED